MTEQEKQLIQDIQTEIYKLPAAQFEVCNEVADHIRRAIKQAGEPVGLLALALVGAEAQAGVPINANCTKPPKEMREELITNGWKPLKGNSTMWQCPTGGWFRGPAHAWHVMKNLPWPSKVDRQIEERRSLGE